MIIFEHDTIQTYLNMIIHNRDNIEPWLHLNMVISLHGNIETRYNLTIMFTNSNIQLDDIYTW